MSILVLLTLTLNVAGSESGRGYLTYFLSKMLLNECAIANSRPAQRNKYLTCAKKLCMKAITYVVMVNLIALDVACFKRITQSTSGPRVISVIMLVAAFL